MRKALRTAAVALAIGFAGLQPIAAQAEPMSSAVTPLGELLDNPGARAVLEKYVPRLVTSERVQQARSQTLKQLANFVDGLPREKLAEIDAELAKLPEPK